VIKEQLRSLGLRHTAEILDDVVAVATKNRWGAQQVFEHVARIEAEERARRSLERRLGRSKLGKFKPFADFDWLLDLGAQESARALDQRLRHYCTRTGLLVIDEIGYLSYDNRNADLLFQAVSRRYERKSIVITSNLAFADWPTIFPNAACTTALIDRLVHHAEIISIEGESYRKREAEQTKEATETRRRKKRS
jgi:DNA replication protein DnaC